MRLAFVNMPFVGISRPSLGLTQLQAVVAAEFSERIQTDLHYLNIDFARYLGETLYASICYLHHDSGVGDWFFRQAAFPDLTDNSDEYFERYYPERVASNRHFRKALLRKRKDLDVYLESLIDKYDLANSDIVGFTSTFTQNVASLALARMLKSHKPQIVTLIGGANCETVMGREIARKFASIDFVFSGSALRSLPVFLKGQIDGNLDDCHRIDGVFSRINTCAVAEAGQTPGFSVSERGIDLPIDTPIALDYQRFLKKLADDFPAIPPVLLFETSRGCWWGEKAHCTFCGLNGDSMTYRSMRPARAIAHIADLFEYSDHCSYLEGVDNIMPKNYPSDVLPFIKRPINVRLFYEVKADLSENDLEIMARSGVTVVQPGIEALSTTTLRLMRKGMTAFQNVAFLKNCRVHGILPVWNLLVGFPGEKQSVYEKYVRDIPRLTHLFPPRGAFPIGFHRFSPYHTSPEQFGVQLRPLDHYELTYALEPSSLARMAFYFADNNDGQEYWTNVQEWLPRIEAQVDLWIKSWFGNLSWSHHRSYEGPKLYFDENEESNLVWDSRTGSLVKHDVSKLGKAILRGFDKAKTLHTMAKALQPLSESELRGQMLQLEEYGLIFHEGDNYLNLVFEHEPKTTLKWFPW